MSRPCVDGSAHAGIQFTATGNVTNLTFRIVTRRPCPSWTAVFAQAQPFARTPTIKRM